MSRIKEHECHKAALLDRNSVVAQARMKNITSLPTDDRVSKMNRKAGTVAGANAARIGEVLQTVPATFTDAEKAQLVKNIYTTGGPSQFCRLLEMAQDATMDAWRGMATIANMEEFKDVGVTQWQNKEWGSEQIKRWWGGNWNAAQWSTYKHIGRKYFRHWGPSPSCYTGI
ncbi:hypothetical protein BKA82DRAFT_4016626 [Pisolithus tinctorius]|nr:hypothetical protein BKA82DRAFT_4016626 [Pisolithus tinctorius]